MISENYRTKQLDAKSIIYCGLFTSLIAIGAFIKIPIPVVPFTLQFLFTTMAGLLLGPRLGSLSVLIYIVLGLIGLPIFTQGGGLGYIFIPTFGYIIGFLVGTFFTGYIAYNREITTKNLLIANFTGLFFVYLIGMVYYYFLGNFVIGSPIGLWPLFLYCFILAVPGDIVICFVCAVLGKRLIPHIKRFN